jgi:hypothetical protein
VAEFVADGNILCLIREFLTAGVLEDGVLHPTVKGTPQGGVISPLLANIVLNVLDHRLIQAGFRLVRYADDFVVVCPSRASAEQALALVAETLQQLGLSLAPDKTRITDRRKGFEFLGFRIAVNSVTARSKSVEKLKDKVRAITQRSHNLDQDAIAALNGVITGFAHYFAQPFSTVLSLFADLDSWIRMRLRCMKFKRISRKDNPRLHNAHLARLNLVSLYTIAANV